MRWIVVAALAALATSAAAQDEDADLKPEPGQEKLIRLAAPGPKDDAKIFPKGAPVSGSVFLRCTLTDKGRLTACGPVREDPPGGGLLAAALQQTSLFRFKTVDRDGQPVAGRKIVIGQSYFAAGDKNPDWLRNPTNDELTSAMPTKALQERKDGSAVISCQITVEGFLDRCSVVSETPDGYGFGAAALHLSKSFAMTPKIRGGVPVPGGTVRIPINWRGLRDGAHGEMTRNRVIANPPWVRAVSAAAVKAAYPKAAAGVPDGQAVVRCKFDKEGATRACEVVSEAPRALGFGQAAKRLATGGFTVHLSPDDMKNLRVFSVDIPFRFRNPTAPDNGRLTDPTWLATLSPKGAELLFPGAAVEKRIKTGLGVVDCAATATGELADCRIQREDPVGLGFGEAALQAAKAMQMNPWTKSGDAVEGRRISLPIRLAVETFADEAPPAGAARP